MGREPHRPRCDEGWKCVRLWTRNVPRDFSALPKSFPQPARNLAFSPQRLSADDRGMGMAGGAFARRALFRRNWVGGAELFQGGELEHAAAHSPTLRVAGADWRRD